MFQIPNPKAQSPKPKACFRQQYNLPLMRNLVFVVAVLLLASRAAAMEVQDVGLSAKGRTIHASIVRAADSAPVVAVVGGLAGEDTSSRVVTQAVDAHDKQPQNRRRYTLIGIAVANPDSSRLVFPPTGTAYRDNTESHALWRWLGIHAPSLVLVAGTDEASLALALSENQVAGIGRIPARSVDATGRLLDTIPATISESEARLEINGRRRRSPRQLADELSRVYGQDFDQFTYIPGMALIGRMRLGQTADVERLVAPYVNGTRNPLDRPNSLVLAGHLVMAELAERTSNPAYLAARAHYPAAVAALDAHLGTAVVSLSRHSPGRLTVSTHRDLLGRHRFVSMYMRSRSSSAVPAGTPRSSAHCRASRLTGLRNAEPDSLRFIPSLYRARRRRCLPRRWRPSRTPTSCRSTRSAPASWTSPAGL